MTEQLNCLKGVSATYPMDSLLAKGYSATLGE